MQGPNHGSAPQNRASVIVQVLAGTLSATEAAKRLGMSRKSYYQWQQRALEGMLGALERGPAGRPAIPGDPAQEQLRKFENEVAVLRQTIAVKNALLEYERGKSSAGNDIKKKKKKRKR